MPSYETVFITLPNLTEDDERATVETLAQIVTQGGGTFFANDRMGRRRLAYPIRKFDDGVYTRFLYDAEKEVPKELERRIRLSDNVLRGLTVVLEKDWAVAAKAPAARAAQHKIEAAAEAERQAAEAALAAEREASESAAAADAVAEAGSEVAPTATASPAADEPSDTEQAEPKPESSAESSAESEEKTDEPKPE